MKRAVHLLRSLLAGAVAGLGALTLDGLLLAVTLGTAAPVGAVHALLYAATGASAGLLAGALWRRAGAGELMAAAFAGVYLPAVAERLVHGFDRLLPQVPLPWLIAGGLLAAPAGFALLGALLRRLAGGPRGTPATLVALTAASGLAVNRNLVGEPTSAAALAADAALLAATCLAAVAVRRFGAPRTTAAAALLVLAAGVGTAFWPSAAPAAAPRAGDNLLFVVIDTQRADVFEEVLAETPEGRRLAAVLDGAVHFDQAIAASPWTIPSMGSLLTGRHPIEHGLDIERSFRRSARFHPLNAALPTLGEDLRHAGYRTEAIVANPILHPLAGVARGFERYEQPPSRTTKLPLLTALTAAGWIDREHYPDGARLRRLFVRRIPSLAAAPRPWFVWLHWMDPHGPLYPHRGLAAEPTSGAGDPVDRLYRDETRYAVREVARCLEALRDAGELDDTWVVLLSDHGEVLPSDGRRSPGDEEPQHGHGQALFEELVRVPLVVRPPGGLPAERRVGDMVHHVDLRDGLLDVLGVDAVRSNGGRAPLARWLGAAPTTTPGDDWALLDGIFRRPKYRGLRTPHEKLLVHPDDAGKNRLYDRRTDPEERRDLAAERPEERRRLEARFAELWGALEAAPENEEEIDPELRRRLKALGYL